MFQIYQVKVLKKAIPVDNIANVSQSINSNSAPTNITKSTAIIDTMAQGGNLSFSNNVINKNQINPLSNSGSNFQQIFNEEEMSNVTSQKKSYSLGKSNTVKLYGNTSTKAIVQRVLPLDYNTGIAGNELTADVDAQSLVTVSRIIDRNGIEYNRNLDENEIRNIRQRNFSPTGEFKFITNSKKVDKNTKIAERSFTAGTTSYLLSPASTVTLYTDTRDILVNPRQGSLGVETFDDKGIHGWDVGVRTPLFIMNLDNDIGYDSYDLGDTYAAGLVETFDEGWSTGTSPYSRKGEDSTYTDDLTDNVNGVNIKFVTTYPYIRGTLSVSYNGVVQVQGTTYNETGSQSFETSFVPLIGDYVVAEYQRYFEGDGRQLDYANTRVNAKDAQNKRNFSSSTSGRKLGY